MKVVSEEYDGDIVGMALRVGGQISCVETVCAHGLILGVGDDCTDRGVAGRCSSCSGAVLQDWIAMGSGDKRDDRGVAGLCSSCCATVLGDCKALCHD